MPSVNDLYPASASYGAHRRGSNEKRSFWVVSYCRRPLESRDAIKYTKPYRIADQTLPTVRI